MVSKQQIFREHGRVGAWMYLQRCRNAGGDKYEASLQMKPRKRERLNSRGGMGQGESLTRTHDTLIPK